MITPSLELCRSVASSAGLPLDFAVKEFYIFNLLEGIAGGSSSKGLIFKGGTALNSVYLGNKRFSEDLDFDMANGQGDKNTASYIESICSSIKGFTGTEVRRFHQTYMIEFMYSSPAGKRDRIRFDMRLGTKGRMLEKPKTVTANSRFTGQSISGVLCYGLEDLVARKMNALEERMEGKDVFDVANAMAIVDKNSLVKAIGHMLKDISKNISAEDFLRSISEKLDAANPGMLSRATNPYIPVSSRPTSWRLLVMDLHAKIEQMIR